MKKILTVLMFVGFMFYLVPQISATLTEQEMAEVNYIVDTANQDIQTQIDNAILESEQVINDYIDDMALLNQQYEQRLDNLQLLQTEIEQLRLEVQANNLYENKVERLNHLIEVKQSVVDSYNEDCQNLTDQLNQTIDSIIDNLLLTTNQISLDAQTACEPYNVVLQCEEIAVTIGDRIVFVDPIIVHTW